jgi:galactokinase
MVPPATDRAAQLFTSTYQRPARWLGSAPGRVNFIGEHTDYNDGFVLPFAIGQRTAIAVAEEEEPVVKLVSEFAPGEVVEFPLAEVTSAAVPGWARYLQGVVVRLVEKGVRVPGFAAAVASDVPAGGGLSSSAALEVALGSALEGLSGSRLDRAELALLAQWAEHHYAKVPCGIMDQFASVMGREGHLLLLDCRTQEVQPIAWRDDGFSILVLNTGVSHSLAGGEYAKRREQCTLAARALGVASLRDATLEQLTSSRSLAPILFRRARHVISENERTLQCAAALETSDWERAGALMFESHYSLRDDYEVSCAELDALVEIAEQLGEERGVLGARMTGGGFGGSVIYLVAAAAAAEVQALATAAYERRTGRVSRSFITRPAAGAGVQELA